MLHPRPVAAGGGSGEAEEPAQAEGLGGGEEALEVIGEVGDGAQAVALIAPDFGVESVDRGLDGDEDAGVASGEADERLLPGRDLGADRVSSTMATIAAARLAGAGAKTGISA